MIHGHRQQGETTFLISDLLSALPIITDDLHIGEDTFSMMRLQAEHS